MFYIYLFIEFFFNFFYGDLIIDIIILGVINEFYIFLENEIF